MNASLRIKHMITFSLFVWRMAKLVISKDLRLSRGQRSSDLTNVYNGSAGVSACRKALILALHNSSNSFLKGVMLGKKEWSVSNLLPIYPQYHPLPFVLTPAIATNSDKSQTRCHQSLKSQLWLIILYFPQQEPVNQDCVLWKRPCKDLKTEAQHSGHGSNSWKVARRLLRKIFINFDLNIWNTGQELTLRWRCITFIWCDHCLINVSHLMQLHPAATSFHQQLPIHARFSLLKETF